ncbi:hypothetical protein [Mangrovibacterium lignilyticum]|uniref:hypothetical protein n=1 Tax=Mangrovibacterium lignilyticum TaxID=2668052 RepID=UPI0013CF5CD0|nr:hypothetical protein [Mangrovibacterium lignilyticum]
MNQIIKNGAIVSKIKNQVIEGQNQVISNKPSGYNAVLQNRFKNEIMIFVLNNSAGYENATFINRLQDLKNLKWVCVNPSDEPDALKNVPQRYQDKKKFESRFLDIYFERKNQEGDHLLIGCYGEGKNGPKYYIGFYLKTQKIEDGFFYYSIHTFSRKYKRISHLKNIVAGVEISRNEFGIKNRFDWSDAGILY